MYEVSNLVKSYIKQLDPKVSNNTLDQIEEIIKYGPFLPYGVLDDPKIKADWLKKRCEKYRKRLNEDIDYQTVKSYLGDFADDIERASIIAYDDTYEKYRGVDCSVRIWVTKNFINQPYIFLVVFSFKKDFYRAVLIEIRETADMMDYFVGMNVLGGLKIVEMWWDICYMIKEDKWKDKLFKDVCSWDYIDKKVCLKVPPKGKIIKQMEFTAKIPIRELKTEEPKKEEPKKEEPHIWSRLSNTSYDDYENPKEETPKTALARINKALYEFDDYNDY